MYHYVYSQTWWFKYGSTFWPLVLLNPWMDLPLNQTDMPCTIKFIQIWCVCNMVSMESKNWDLTNPQVFWVTCLIWAHRLHWRLVPPEMYWNLWRWILSKSCRLSNATMENHRACQLENQRVYICVLSISMGHGFHSELLVITRICHDMPGKIPSNSQHCPITFSH